MSSYNPDDEDDEYDQDYASWDDRRERLITSLSHRITDIEKCIEREEELRAEYPSLQDAWEKYQIVLRTVS